MNALRRYAYVFIIIFLCVASRLPQLTSPELLADGDECVIGLMSKHFIEGKEIPIFFHGQAYGFSLFECLPVSASFFLFGVNDLGLKIPMLLLFILSMLLFYKSLIAINPNNKRLALLITLVFIFLPSWALWSMKARGGYLTALLFSNLLIWLVHRSAEMKNKGQWILLGLLLVIIFQSQPLWLPGLLPIIGYRLYPQLKKKNILLLILGIVPLSLFFAVLKFYSSHQWHPKVFSYDLQTVWHNIIQLPVLLLHYFNGYYYLYYIYQAPLICNIAAVISILIVVLLVIAGLLDWVKNKHNLFLLSVLSILLTIGYSIFLKEHTPRYLMPLSGYMLLSLFLLLRQNRSRLAIPALCFFCLFIGMPAMIQFRNYTFFPATKKEVMACVDYLKQKDIHYAFSNDGLLQWEIMFYSNEEVICRESDPNDRYPEYVTRVNNAYLENNKHLAIVDNTTDLLSIEPDSTVNIISHFYILLRPQPSVMHDMEFKF